MELQNSGVEAFIDIKAAEDADEPLVEGGREYSSLLIWLSWPSVLLISADDKHGLPSLTKTGTATRRGDV